MADVKPLPRDYISEWADELIEQVEASLAKHAEFERLYPILPLEWNHEVDDIRPIP